MNDLPIQTYESVVQQRDALEKKLADMAAENAELKSRVVIVPAKSYVKDMRCNVVRWAKVIDALSDAGVAFVRDDGELIAGAKETPATDAFIRELMAKGVDALQIPESFKTISDNIRTQDNSVTSHPLFAVMQKREIVVDGDYDHDRFVWVDEEGQEATDHQKRRLDLFIKNFREPPEKWRHLAVKEINEFVTACFTEQGCKDYLDANGHNLRYPFIYVFSAYRNAEFIAVREWLAKGINDAQ